MKAREEESMKKCGGLFWREGGEAFWGQASLSELSKREVDCGLHKTACLPRCEHEAV